MSQQLLFLGDTPSPARRISREAKSSGARLMSCQDEFAAYLREFQEFGKRTIEIPIRAVLSDDTTLEVPGFVNEYWTSAQRAASPLHEVSYRACFKPQLPRFFIERLTQPGDRVYDPFMGRGTTLIEAALLGRIPLGCDVNPLSVRLVRPRLRPPTLQAITDRLKSIDLGSTGEIREDLLVFYHPETLKAITGLRQYLLERSTAGALDPVDDWIGMVALNRLTGHSPGFFSVYTLPPNQATSVTRQIRINEKRKQVPPFRDIREIILKKSKQLLGEMGVATRSGLEEMGAQAELLTSVSSSTPQLKSDSVHLVVTSPPFLNIVQYATDNWLRCWFVGVDASAVPITMTSRVARWREVMSEVLRELRRVLRPGGYVAFEVGEVSQAGVKLEEQVMLAGVVAGLKPEFVLINDQKFTKTANCWGVDNNSKGTNTNRVVLLTKN